MKRKTTSQLRFIVVVLMLVSMVLAIPVAALPTAPASPHQVGDSTRSALDAIRVSLETAGRWTKEARGITDQRPIGPLEMPREAIFGLDEQDFGRLEQALGPRLLEAVALLVQAIEAGTESGELSQLVNDLLPVLREGSSDISEDIEIRPAGGPPGSAGSIYIADKSSRVYDFQDIDGAFGHGGGIFIDLGGDDTYLARGVSFGSLGGLFIDIEGNDTYTAGYRAGDELPAGGRYGDFGHMSFGSMGVFVDAAGSDSYYANMNTFGAGQTGVFYEAAGIDSYRSGSDSNGNTGSFGYGQGRFIELSGDDTYVAAANSFGSARGVFIEMDGDDQYQLENDETSQAPAHVNSFGSSVGGVMVEYAGNDNYWVKGGNLNFGANGVFVERDGDDWYGRDENRLNNRNGHTRFGFGSLEGVFVDLRGDDNYFARDTSFGYGAGTFLDLEGDDAYHVAHDAANSAQGCVNACHSFGIGLVNPPGGWFLDYSGNDTYETDRRADLSARGTFGTLAGVFIERRGNDSYSTGREAFSSHGLPPGLATDLEGDDHYDVLDGRVGAIGVFVDDGGSPAMNNQMVVAGEGTQLPNKPFTVGGPPGPDPVLLVLGLERSLADLVDEIVCGQEVAQEAGVCPFPGSSKPSPSPTPDDPGPRATHLSLDGSPPSGQFTDQVDFVAKLTDETGEPIADATIAIELQGAGDDEGDALFTQTDSEGEVSVAFVLDREPGDYLLKARFDPDAEQGDDYVGSSAVRAFTVMHEETTLSVDVSGTGTNRFVDASLVDHDTPSYGVGGAMLYFYVDGVLFGEEISDGAGRARVQAPPGARGKGKTYVWEVRFDGDAYWSPNQQMREAP